MTYVLILHKICMKETGFIDLRLYLRKREQIMSENSTLEYYNQNSKEFTSDTRDVTFTDIQDYFLSYLKPGALILDFGCGSGRDTKYFLSKGYRTEAIDGSEEMVKIASENTGITVKKLLFEELEAKDRYDGIFACASILHVPYAKLPGILTRIYNALKETGIAYISFKYGTFEGERNGRYFTDMTDEKLNTLLKEVPGFVIEDVKITGDARPGRSDEKWLNAILRKENYG